MLRTISRLGFSVIALLGLSLAAQTYRAPAAHAYCIDITPVVIVLPQGLEVCI